MGARDSNSDRMHWRLKGSETVALASAGARTFGEEQWLTDDETARLCIIVEELVTNLVDHAGLGPDDEIELELSSDPDGIHLVLIDPCPPFDPRTAPRSEQPERGGGAGIDIVRAWAEFLDYSSKGGRNRLELRMPVAQQG